MEIAKLETTVSYLEMRAPPSGALAPAPRADLTVVHAVKPTVSFYRYLYNNVGADWLWGDRRKVADAELAAIIQDPLVEVDVLYAAGVPAGYIELDRRSSPEIELAYFGLLPEFIGQGLGTWLLDWGIHRAWSYGPVRLWVHTQTLDHPRALPLYQRRGFTVYKTEQLVIDDPRALGLL